MNEYFLTSLLLTVCKRLEKKKQRVNSDYILSFYDLTTIELNVDYYTKKKNYSYLKAHHMAMGKHHTPLL
jgi:hypothetical protein